MYYDVTLGRSVNASRYDARLESQVCGRRLHRLDYVTHAAMPLFRPPLARQTQGEPGTPPG